MKKSTLLMVLSLVLALTIGLGTTLAYLTDTDSDVNVMTLGNVDILQNEQQWNEDKTELEEFENDKPLYPYVPAPGKTGVSWDESSKEDSSYRRFGMNNVVDKYVTVTNTGKSDAYVRTIIAAEMGEYETVDEFRNKIVGFSRNVENGDEFKFPGTWVWNDFFVAEIEGHNYMIMVATHQDAVKPGETTIPSLLQIYMNKDCGNEEVEKLDGNGNGKYDVLVLSQAVQTAGFDSAEEALNEAFPMGENNANVPDWFTGWTEDDIGSPGKENETNNPPIVIDTMPELKEALKKGGKVIVGADLAGSDPAIANAESTSLDLNQYTFTGRIDVQDEAKLVVEDGTIINKDIDNSAITANTGTNVVLNNVTIESARHAVRAEGGDVTINSGTYKVVPVVAKTLHALNVSDGSTVIVNGGTFVGPKGTVADSGAAVNVQADSTVIINGGNFSGGKNNTVFCDDNGTLIINGGNFSGGKNNTVSCKANGTLIIKGGTFDQDPTKWVAEGYEVIQNGNVYTVSAKEN